MTNEEFEQLEFEHAEAITKAEKVYRDTEGDLSRAVIAAIEAMQIREMTAEDVAEIALKAISEWWDTPENERKKLDCHLSGGIAKALSKLGTIRIVGEV